MSTALEDAVKAARVYFADHDISVGFIKLKTKERRVVSVRNFVMAYMRARDPKRYSLPVIQRCMGFRDHTTVLNGIRNAHRDYGQVLFQRLNMERLKDGGRFHSIPQAEHTAVTLEEIIARGEFLMHQERAIQFVNGQGWKAA